MELMIVQTIIIALTTTYVLASALGQVPGDEGQGPEPSTQQSEIEALKAKVRQLEQSVMDIKKKNRSLLSRSHREPTRSFLPSIGNAGW
ncbi:MAG: hypothetical protein HC801_06050 [Nitrospira sp.]|nr:hypothetical protein [Nitrospira sp.]